MRQNTNCLMESIARRQQPWGLVYGRPKKVRKHPICNKNFDTAKSTIEFAILAGCWSRQQHMAGAVTRSPWLAAAVAVWALLQKPQEVEVEVKGEQLSRSGVSRVLQ